MLFRENRWLMCPQKSVHALQENLLPLDAFLKGRFIMARLRHSSEQIIAKLRETEVLHAQDKSLAVACKRLEVTEQTYYRWRKA